MDSEVLTKDELLRTLSKRGCYVDSVTLDAFLEQWKIEAIFEDEIRGELFDSSVLEFALSHVADINQIQKAFQSAAQRQQKRPRYEDPDEYQYSVDDILEQQNINLNRMQRPNVQPQPQPQQQQPYQVYQNPMQPMINQPYVQGVPFQPQGFQPFISMPVIPNQINIAPQPMQNNIAPPMQNNMGMNNMLPPRQQQMQQARRQPPKKRVDFDSDYDLDILNDISLSNGAKLSDKIDDMPIPENLKKPKEFKETTPKEQPKKEKKIGILEGALEDFDSKIEMKEDEDDVKEKQKQEEIIEEDFDDMNLLSESFEAQEKFKEYVLSQMGRPGGLAAGTGNEFKLDISEKTINMLARTMAKKIAKHVNILLNKNMDLQTSKRMKALEEFNKKLETKAHELEEQNRKLKLLLAESNKNLNSYKPSIFGFYRKVKVQAEK